MSHLRELHTLRWDWIVTGFGGDLDSVYVDPAQVASIEPYVPASAVKPEREMYPPIPPEDHPRMERALRSPWTAITLKNGHAVFVSMRSDYVHDTLYPPKEASDD